VQRISRKIIAIHKGFKILEKLKKEIYPPGAADLRSCMPGINYVDNAKIEAHKKLLRSLFKGSFEEGYTCLSCGQKRAGMASALAHVEGHLDITVPCTLCPRTFKTRSGVYYHMRDVHGLKTFSRRQYSCDVQYNPAKVANTEGERLQNGNNQDFVVQDLEGAVDAVLQGVKVEADEEANI